MLRLVPQIKDAMVANDAIYGSLTTVSGVELNSFREDLKKYHNVTSELVEFNLIFSAVWEGYKDTDWKTISDLFNELW